MPKVPGVIPSAAAGVPLIPTKRTRLEYSTVAKTGLIDPPKKSKNQKKKFEKISKKNKMITNPKLSAKNYTEVSIKHLLDGSEPQSLKKICFGCSGKSIGCGWSQFSGYIEYVSSFIVEQAIQSMKTPIFVNERRVVLYQTIKLEEDVQNIIDKKNGKKKLVLKSLNEFQNYQNFIKSSTNDRTFDRAQDGTNSLGKKQDRYRDSNCGPEGTGSIHGGHKIKTNFDQPKPISSNLTSVDNSLLHLHVKPTSVDSDVNGALDRNSAKSNLLETSKVDPTNILKALLSSLSGQSSKGYNAPKIARFGSGFFEILEKSKKNTEKNSSASQIFCDSMYMGCLYEFNELMRAIQPKVFSVQKTLLNKKSYQCGSGLLIDLKNNSGFQIYELKQHPHWMTVKRKKDAILSFNRHFKKINDNKPYQILMFLGNYNMDIVQLQKFMLKYGLNLAQCQVENFTGSQYNGLNMGRMLDHILYRDMSKRQNYCIVSHIVDLSDHLLIQNE
ncbi:hypothetical protein BB561_000370 [Smittium simulii]|uniref:Uncharacterized protein n=1 Tax=Smittium simulii TaxID=133385 RepID=A0A2T9YZL6_9FUNG|nr:hypothetical protein BB561_000370 [Smittium simulii]